MKILKFKAGWCQPCKSLTEQLKGVTFPVPMEEIDIDSNQELAQMYGVRSVPTMVMVDDYGDAVESLIGLHDTPTIAKTFGGQLLN